MSADRRSFFFGTTLSEIGFILFFALLIFAFYQHQQDRLDLEIAEAENESIGATLESQQEAFSQIDERLQSVSDEERKAFFDELVPVLELQARLDTLEKESAVRNTQLAELAEIQDLIADVSGDDGGAAGEIRDALRLKAGIEEAFGTAKARSPELVSEAIKARDVIEKFNERTTERIIDADSLAQRLDDSLHVQDLEGQVRNLTGRLGGRDLPPCWAHRETGNVEYLFDIVITDAGLLLTSAAPDHRRQEFDALINTGRLTGDRISLETFETLAAPILALTNGQDCRHYVRVTDRSENSYKFTLTIEDYFYKFVNRS
jgi:hypothetical protein